MQRYYMKCSTHANNQNNIIRSSMHNYYNYYNNINYTNIINT